VNLVLTGRRGPVRTWRPPTWRPPARARWPARALPERSWEGSASPVRIGPRGRAGRRRGEPPPRRGTAGGCSGCTRRPGRRHARDVRECGLATGARRPADGAGWRRPVRSAVSLWLTT